jgi:hypothetical protein
VNCRIRHGNGTFGEWRPQLAKTDEMLLDNWGMTAPDAGRHVPSHPKLLQAADLPGMRKMRDT